MKLVIQQSIMYTHSSKNHTYNSSTSKNITVPGLHNALMCLIFPQRTNRVPVPPTGKQINRVMKVCSETGTGILCNQIWVRFARMSVFAIVARTRSNAHQSFAIRPRVIHPCISHCSHNKSRSYSQSPTK